MLKQLLSVVLLLAPVFGSAAEFTNRVIVADFQSKWHGHISSFVTTLDHPPVIVVNQRTMRSHPSREVQTSGETTTTTSGSKPLSDLLLVTYRGDGKCSVTEVYYQDTLASNGLPLPNSARELKELYDVSCQETPLR